MTIRAVLAIASPLALLAFVLAPCSAKIAPPEPLPKSRTVAPGPFTADWPSLISNYKCPDWFRDAKLGIWAHWGPQCQPGEGDWYARTMYVQGTRQNLHHVATHGHPSESGFMEQIHQWKADRWDPEDLMRRYVAAGARYFVAMANHEDNFDNYDSRYHAWNAVNVGPKRDVMAAWAKAARAHGLRFGVSNHSSHAWHWFQPAYGYDPEGPLAGVRYDAWQLKPSDGIGKWWEGLDPMDLYCRPSLVLPKGITTTQDARAWHDKFNLPWTEEPPPGDQHFVDLWFHRLADLLEKFDPDFLYLDNTELPLGQAGLDIAAHFYNSSIARRGGVLDVVLTAKGLSEERRPAVVQDYERSAPRSGIQPQPFETGTCIGQWHYQDGLEYKTVAQIVRNLVDVVSKNGTLLLSIPQRGDGTIDEREIAFLDGLGAWMRIHGEAIYETRPWHVHGEGPTEIPRGRAADGPIPYTQEDIRFTKKGDTLFAFVLSLPKEPVTIETLGTDSPHASAIMDVALVGSDVSVEWTQTAAALVLQPAEDFPGNDVCAFAIRFR